MKNPSKAERILDFLENNPGRHRTGEIAAAIGTTVNATSPVLTGLANNREIRKIKQGIYTAIDTGNPFQQILNKNISELREAEANADTINVLMNTYDVMLAAYQSWVIKNINENMDFEKQLLCLENLKWLTMIADRLMKRWALVHVGYDTNTRQAQEDAKLKTAEKEQAALAAAPLEDQLQVVGHFHTDMKVLWDELPEPEAELELEPEPEN